MEGVCTETRNRIKVCVWAYAYEIKDNPIVPDYQFDELCKKIDLSVSTTNPQMDKWFKDNFNPYTGQWIHSHPNIERIAEIYDNVKDVKPKELTLEDMF